MSKTDQAVRIGIDVGGTFTDVVVLDQSDQQVIAQLKIPTTHHAEEGVAKGIIDAIHQVLEKLNIQPEQVTFIAHSTTQATNALLEGDVASVGVIGVGAGWEQLKARLDTRIPRIELAPQRFLQPASRFLAGSKLSYSILNKQLEAWKKQGIEVVVSSSAFGVDDPSTEQLITQKAQEKGFFATCGHEVSSLYGLRTRTRTAVINGAILPKMIHTATMTDDCVKKAGIKAPLMIMRSDGGVMSMDEVRRRPIMTMLSGPAAGIAGALMHERVSDGIFIEVGGTSADISVIRDGLPQTKAARVGGHRTFLHTLDVRTIAIAGGSMIREKNGRLVDVGSRSAHIAGLPYACFQEPRTLEGARLVHLQPTEKDPEDYIAIQNPSGQRFALTPTCAANLLGLIPEGAFAKGNREAAKLGFVPLAEKMGKTVEECATEVLKIACQKVAQQIEALVKEYHLDRNTLELIGGGGGAAALVFYTGQLMNLPARLAKNAEVISTIGVAMAMVRETIERNIVDPQPADLLQIRREAFEALVGLGALPETIEVQVEVDTRRNLVRATAFGTTELRKETDENAETAPRTGFETAAHSLRCPLEQVKLLGETSGLQVYGTQVSKKTWAGLAQKTVQVIRVLDKKAVVRLQRSNVNLYHSKVGQALGKLEQVLKNLTDFGDAGRSLPTLQVLVGSRIIHLSGLAEPAQVLAIARTELENVPAEEDLVIIANLE
jgi:N-methylhydantoinase A/oxoprolinase/acetone carboxylase beta subunit